MKKALLNSLTKPKTLSFSGLKNSDNAKASRLFTAIFLGDAKRVAEELSGKEGADPLDRANGEMSLPESGAGSGSADGFYASALEFCGGVCADPAVFDEMAKAAWAGFDEHNARATSSWGKRSEEDWNAPERHLGDAIKLAGKMIDRVKENRKISYAWAYAWTNKPMGERKAFVARAIKAMRKGSGMPWEELASREELLDELGLAIELFAKTPETAGAALAACVKHKRHELARLTLARAGGQVDASPAIAAALGIGDQELAGRLNQPLHAWAIMAGQADWVRERLEGEDLEWVSQSACHTVSFGPLAAALEAGELELARRLIEKGASPNAMTETGAGALAPLLALRAAAGDEAGCRMLLAAGADTRAFDARWEIGGGVETSAAGAAALAGHEAAVRLALANGASAEAVGAKALAKLARERPQLRSLFGKEGALAYFGRRAREIAEGARRAAESISQEAARRGLPGAKGEGEDWAQEAAPEGFGMVKPGARLMEFRQGARASEMGSRLEEGGLSLAKARAQLAALGLDAAREERSAALIAQAVELAPAGRLPADGQDSKDLKRLWEVNMPLLLKAIEAIPPEDRDRADEESGKTAWQALDDALESAGGAMMGMRARALRQARVRLEAERAVMEANARLSQEREAALAELEAAGAPARAASKPAP